MPAPHNAYFSGMKTIVLFGAGKSSSVLIHYLKDVSSQYNWHLFVADASVAIAAQKVGNHPLATPVGIDVYDDDQRTSLVQKANVVISLLPPLLHILVAKDCLYYNKHLLTASYVDEHIKALEKDIKNKGLLFLCEMGLDPGIDHMSAMQLIHQIQNNGGEISSFRSHCGGLVAPESDDNPWHYKISWNPRNVILAGKAGAVYKEDGIVKNVAYEELFSNNHKVSIPHFGEYAWYANRDSISYAKLYGLENVQTFIRTTLRHPDFCVGWKHIIDLQLTNEAAFYDTDGLSIAAFFKERNITTSTIKDDLFLQQLLYLGLREETPINRGKCSTADVLQFLLERKLALQSSDKDLVLMLHEIEYVQNEKRYKTKSCLAVKGDDNVDTAMAKTVGLPLGIAATLLLQNKIEERGLHIPIIPSIYQPVLKELAQHGISFVEF